MCRGSLRTCRADVIICMYIYTYTCTCFSFRTRPSLPPPPPLGLTHLYDPSFPANIASAVVCVCVCTLWQGKKWVTTHTHRQTEGGLDTPKRADRVEKESTTCAREGNLDTAIHTHTREREKKPTPPIKMKRNLSLIAPIYN